MWPESFMHNSVKVRIVPDERFTETAFYVSKEGSYGIRLYKDGRRMTINGTPCTNANSKYNGYRKQHYQHFKHAWRQHAGILVSHAVYRAWRGPIPEGMTIDHIDGCTTHNDFRNLRAIPLDINMRDGGFLRKLRHKGIDPTKVQRNYLLRYFDRMAKLKPSITQYRYKHLTREDLTVLLYGSNEDVLQLTVNLFHGKSIAKSN